MKIHQIRNATVLITYGGKKFLVDPYLAEKEVYPGFEGTVNSHLRNPRVELKTPMETILDVDAVIVTHLHADHWDEAAVKIVPKGLKIFAQNYTDAELLKAQGFTDVNLLSFETKVGNVTLTRAPGQHGSDEAYFMAGELLGSVCGVVFRAEGEKTLYLSGDTVWNDYVVKNIETYLPEVIVVPAGDAQVPGLGSIIMNTADIRKLYDAAPKSRIVANHIDAVNHCVLSRAELRDFLKQNQMEDRVLVPEDGEELDGLALH